MPPVPEECSSQKFWLFRCLSEHLAVTSETPVQSHEFLCVLIQNKLSVPYVGRLVEVLPPRRSGFRPRVAFVRFKTVFLDALLISQ
jgi:hypothetical protein